MAREEAPRQAPKGMDGLMAEALGRDGVFTAEDARRWDISPSALTRAIKKGRLQRLLPRVYVVAGAATTWWTHARAAAAWSRGALSHLSAAFALGLIESPPAELDVVATTVRKAPPGAPIRCHHSRFVSPPHIVTVRSIPITASARTLLDIAPLVSEDVLEGALEEALRRGLVSMARLEWQRFRSTRLPPPKRQHRVVDAGKFIARIDFAYPESRIAIEAKSYRWHSGRREWLRDEERHRDLRDLGWQVIEVTDEDITRRGSRLETEIAELLGITLF